MIGKAEYLASKDADNRKKYGLFHTLVWQKEYIRYSTQSRIFTFREEVISKRKEISCLLPKLPGLEHGRLINPFINRLKAWDTFYYHGLTIIPAWISIYIHYKVWDEITYPFLNFNGWSLGMDK